MGTWTESSLWASVLWGAIASGYFIYGWRQRSMIPFIAGIIMTAASCLLSWLPMSLVCIAAIFGAWWFIRQGY
ncbi:MAG TPA: hypothetical protein VMO20_02780 [Candidatus Acidoferrum sp.]|jgi:hypothetical protein|nr:hypothetical protein [Candidatus Acidoferrum sp.]